MAENFGTAQRGREILVAHRQLQNKLGRFEDHRKALETEGAMKAVAKVNAEIDLKDAETELNELKQAGALFFKISKVEGEVKRLNHTVSVRQREIDEWNIVRDVERDDVDEERRPILKQQEDAIKELNELGSLWVKDEEDAAYIPIMIKAGLQCGLVCTNGFIYKDLMRKGIDCTLVKPSITSEEESSS